jgi:hypothetical protein
MSSNCLDPLRVVEDDSGGVREGVVEVFSHVWAKNFYVKTSQAEKKEKRVSRGDVERR